MALAATLAAVGYLAWMAALAGTAAAAADGPTLAAAQTLAMIGTTAVGAVLIQARDETIGFLLVAGSVAMLIPWTVTWLAFGAAWTAVGIVLEMERPSRSLRGLNAP